MTNTNIYQEQTTIVIPSREYDFLVVECIKKIRELYKSIQIILVLDEINETAKQNIENVLVVKSENKNMSAKRNLGVSFAKTEYIAFLDSDAYPNRNWLESGITFLNNNKDYSAITGTQYNPPTDNFVQNCLRLVRYSPLFTHKEWFIIIDKNAQEQDCNVLITSNVIMRKNDYEKINGMNENIYLAEDNEFSERLVKSGYKIRFIPNASVFHREATMYPFLRKIYCMSYYYANTFIKGKLIKGLKQSLLQFLPLFAVIFYLILFTFTEYKLQLLIFPFLAIILLIKCALAESKKLETSQLKAFFIIFFTYCIFCAIWVIGTLLGSINFPTKSIQKCYKNY